MYIYIYIYICVCVYVFSGLVSLFNCISTFVSYLMPKPILRKYISCMYVCVYIYIYICVCVCIRIFWFGFFV